ncbi:hypothetical protein CEK29_04265 [Bordetella genomosp. 5]|uniref:DUF1963 domain-containing protein n=1 Tax=Bordetella genomosp. 5 TaxID=1395608 RepID=UPI000B9E0425|nr:DUF1963 domain-containing protein [Bordetella genomosp. 5]OZI46118.1 hypothetical protein CEK29_04265 [Bordetella genomosp. 5]
MFDSPQDAQQAFDAFFEPHQAAQVVQALVPVIGLQPVSPAVAPATAAGETLGASRFGGVPDLPAGAAWPVPPAPANADEIAGRGNSAAGAEMRDHLSRNLPYAFMGQIDLEEAHRLGPVAQALPPNGRLLFFYDLSVGPWESGSRVAHVVWDNSPRQALVPLAMPPALAEAAEQERREREAIRKQFKQPASNTPMGTNYGTAPQSLELKAAVGVPDPASLEMAAVPALQARYHGKSGDAAAEAFAEAYDEMREDLNQDYPTPGWRRHQLLGSPLPEQDDPRYQAVVVTEYGVEFLGREAWQRERERIMALAGQWRLLLQVDLSAWYADPLTEGTVYFVIRTDDLAARRFDRVVAVYQQT